MAPATHLPAPTAALTVRACLRRVLRPTIQPVASTLYLECAYDVLTMYLRCAYLALTSTHNFALTCALRPSAMRYAYRKRLSLEPLPPCCLDAAGGFFASRRSFFSQDPRATDRWPPARPSRSCCAAREHRAGSFTALDFPDALVIGSRPLSMRRLRANEESSSREHRSSRRVAALHGQLWCGDGRTRKIDAGAAPSLARLFTRPDVRMCAGS